MRRLPLRVGSEIWREAFCNRTQNRQFTIASLAILQELARRKPVCPHTTLSRCDICSAKSVAGRSNRIFRHPSIEFGSKRKPSTPHTPMATINSLALRSTLEVATLPSVLIILRRIIAKSTHPPLPRDFGEIEPDLRGISEPIWREVTRHFLQFSNFPLLRINRVCNLY